MIEERGRVIGVETAAVRVQTLRQGTCSACSAKAGCGQGLLQQLGSSAGRGEVRALSAFPLGVGDEVVLGIREDLLLKCALMFYLFPLLGLFAATLLAWCAGLAEPWLILAGLAGFLVTWLWVRRHARRHSDDPALQPVVLRTLVTGAEGPA